VDYPWNITASRFNENLGERPNLIRGGWREWTRNEANQRLVVDEDFRQKKTEATVDPSQGAEEDVGELDGRRKNGLL